MTIKLVEEFIYDLKEGKETASDALRDVFGTSDVSTLLAGLEAEKETAKKEVFGSSTPPMRQSSPDELAADQAIAVSRKHGGIDVGGRVIPHEQLVQMLTDPKFRQILASMRSMKDPKRISSLPSSRQPSLPVVRR
jgi:hypothetical protein